MNRGSRSARGSLAYGCPRFNEAPIHESGKYRRGAAAATRGAGFNEAPIHESGKSNVGVGTDPYS